MNKVVLILVLMIGFVATNSSMAGDQGINQKMTEIGQTMVQTFPLIVAKRQISTQEKQQLQQAVRRLSKLFREAKPFIESKSETYQISYDLILEYLEETERAFQKNNTEYARKRLYSLGSICASCHTQDTQLRTLFPGTTRNNFSDDLGFAEFNYTTRNYNQAVKYYDKYLHSESPKTELDLIATMQRLMTIYTQVYNTPGVAAKQLAEYRNLKDHTQKSSKHLEGWIKGLKNLYSSGVTQVNNPDFVTLEKYVAKYIGDVNQAEAELFATPEDEVARLWLRGQLYHYLNSNPPAKELPVILYWLSICDRSLGYDYNFSLADLYLKQCIRDYSAHPYAKRCYQEYETFIETMYSGSAGVFIPPELKDELEDLNALINKY